MTERTWRPRQPREYSPIPREYAGHSPFTIPTYLRHRIAVAHQLLAEHKGEMSREDHRHLSEKIARLHRVAMRGVDVAGAVNHTIRRIRRAVSNTNPTKKETNPCQ